MRFFIIWDSRIIKRAFFITLILLFSAIFFYSQSALHIPVLQTTTESKAIYKGEKGIALTFNISWGEVQAEPIIDILETNKVSAATFFVSGAWAEKNPDLIQRILKLGYEIGSLGYAYQDYTETDESKIRQDMTKSIEVLKKLNINNVRFIRSPTGHFDKKTLKVANELGLTLIHWSVNSYDWKNPGTKTIIQNVVAAKKGDIILLHASDSATQTAKALPSIIEELNSQLTPLELLISKGKVQTKLIN